MVKLYVQYKSPNYIFSICNPLLLAVFLRKHIYKKTQKTKKRFQNVAFTDTQPHKHKACRVYPTLSLVL
ncbi:hypothetical protein XENTR_v10000967 [Xenopus tropicalis]|nr:hypothetical protein XENTR_v10000967 [Xenopus tropicalis]